MAQKLSIAERFNALPYSLLFVFWGGTIVLFAFAYFLLSFIPGHGPIGIDGSLLSRFGNSLYYSVITATNTGYGDIVPVGFSRLFAATQSITELFLFALFVAKLVTHRQDLALSEIHKLSFELTFHNMREDLFIARKDFDMIVRVARESSSVSAQEWERLTIAYQLITTLLQEIPNFYNVTSDLYVIDPRREMLLLEALERTMTRIDRIIATFEKAQIPWKEDAESLTELRTLITTLEDILPLWKHHSHDTHPAFGTITKTYTSIRAQLA
jgi:hypothetical protein